MQKLSVVKNAEVAGWLSGVNSTESSSWVKIKRFVVSGTILDQTITGLDGDKDERYMIRVTGIAGALGMTVAIQFNGDATNGNYIYHAHQGGYSSTNGMWGTVKNAATSAQLANFYSGGVSDAMAEVAAKSGKQRWVHNNNVVATASTQDFSNLLSTRWTNTCDNITSMRVFSTDIFTGTVEVFKLSSLATYELVKEYVLNGQTLNDTFDFDGESFDTLKVISQTTGAIWCRLNGDASSNYFNGEFFGA